MAPSEVEVAFLHAARRTIDPSRPLLVAVSGGGDSVALARLVARLAPARRPTDWRLIHLDHGLRRDADDDRRFVESLAATLGVPCIAGRREVPTADGDSPEEAARRVRRAYLLEHAAPLGAAVALGHTLDDQAETILMRQARGAGPTALTGMTERGPGPFVRPLLAVERASLRDWLREQGHSWREDPHNADPRFDRTHARELLRALRERLNPRAAGHIVEAATRLRADLELLDELATARFEVLRTAGASGLELDARGLAAEPPALAARVAAIALERAGIDPRRILAAHVEAVVDLARGGRGRTVDLPGDRRAVRRDRGVLIGPSCLVD